MTPLQNCGELHFTRFVPASHTLPYGWRLMVAARTTALVGGALPSNEQALLSPVARNLAHPLSLANYWLHSFSQPAVLSEGKLGQGWGGTWPLSADSAELTVTPA